MEDVQVWKTARSNGKLKVMAEEDRHEVLRAEDCQRDDAGGVQVRRRRRLGSNGRLQVTAEDECQGDDGLSPTSSNIQSHEASQRENR